jgi:hypothetical protein
MEVLNTLMMETFLCPYCNGRTDKSGGTNCRHCGQNLVIAQLTSKGSGVVPKDETFFLYPMVMRLGSGGGNDFVIKSNALASRQCRFAFEDVETGFTLIDPNQGSTVNGSMVPREGTLLSGGDVIIIKGEVFVYTFPVELEEEKGSRALKADTVMLREMEAESALRVARDSDDQIQKYMMVLVALLTETNYSYDLEKIIVFALDALIDMIGLNRGVCYLVEDDEDNQMTYHELAGRKFGGMNLNKLDRRVNYPIHEELLNMAMETMEIIIAGSDSDQLSKTEVGYKALVCIPLCIYDDTGTKKVRGLLYTDSLTEVEMDDYCEVVLQIVSKIVSLALAKVDTYERLKTMSELMVEMEKIITEDLGSLEDVEHNIEHQEASEQAE